MITDWDGSVVVAGTQPTGTGELGSLANAGHVVRLLRAGNVVPRPGQRLTVWIEDGRYLGRPRLISDEAIDRAAAAFHAALDAHVDGAAAIHGRAGDWVDAAVTEVVEALLLDGWIPALCRDRGDGSPVPWPRAEREWS